MKIGIITVFKTENCGSFLQAWALNEQLSSMGNDVYFADYTPYQNAWRKIYSIIKCCLLLRFKRAGSILEKNFEFKKLQKTLKKETLDREQTSLCFFGSDTLWNFDDGFFAKEVDFFTGADLNMPCYTYSISVASTSSKRIEKLEGATDNIKKFKLIAVRDTHTQNVISEFYPVEKIIRTIDPTMLIDKHIYIRRFSSHKPFPDKSLVLYYFGDIPEETWGAIKDFAVKKKLAIVNIGLYEKVFDYSLTFTPSNFITAFSRAEYIFTNTFHGCVFSTIFNKNFVTDGNHKKKIQCFLEEFSLLDRVVSSPNDIEKVFAMPINYELVNILVKEKRMQSIEYLEHCLNEVNGNE